VDELKMTTNFFCKHVFVCKFKDEYLGPNINRNASVFASWYQGYWTNTVNEKCW